MKWPPEAAAIKRLEDMVGARGFEPPTSRSQTERTTRLCYAPKTIMCVYNRNKMAILAVGPTPVKTS